MIIDLEPIFNIEGESCDFDYPLDLSGESFVGFEPFKTPIKVKGIVANRTGVVEIKAVASFVLDIACDRCAKELKVPLNIDINHTLVKDLNDDDNFELLLIDEFQFDLDTLVTEDIFLNLPAKFLCSEDCKGLCPACGSDLNEGKCSCKKAIDPRLEVLAQLLDK